MTCDMATHECLATVGFPWKGPSCFQGIKMFSISSYQLISIPYYSIQVFGWTRRIKIWIMWIKYSLLSQDAHHLVNRDSLKIQFNIHCEHHVFTTHWDPAKPGTVMIMPKEWNSEERVLAQEGLEMTSREEISFLMLYRWRHGKGFLVEKGYSQKKSSENIMDNAEIYASCSFRTLNARVREMTILVFRYEKELGWKWSKSTHLLKSPLTRREERHGTVSAKYYKLVRLTYKHCVEFG